jgi:hypothetical protein
MKQGNPNSSVSPDLTAETVILYGRARLPVKQLCAVVMEKDHIGHSRVISNRV